MPGAAIDHVTGVRCGSLRTVYLLASTADEFGTCRRVVDRSPLLHRGRAE